MSLPKIHKCVSCGDALDAPFRCWNIDCKFAGITQEPPRNAGAGQTQAQQLLKPDLCEDESLRKLALGDSVRKIPMHAGEELKLTGMDTFSESGAQASLQFNRVLTDHERVSLEMMIRLFLKGYANAR